MASFARKVLWIVTMNQAAETRLLQHAQASGADAVCIRTDNSRLPNAIGRFKQAGFKVYGWRWPAVTPRPSSTTHYYADDEAGYVVDKLIPAGLDGYIMDPESDNNSPSNDWNKTGTKPLAQGFCDAIRNGATMHELREFAGHADIRTTEVYFVRKEADAEVAPSPDYSYRANKETSRRV